MIKYTLGLVKQEQQLLLLNREKSSWMGCWNGVGGKLEQGESPKESMYREIVEETGLQQVKLVFKGVNIWSTPAGHDIGGMYLFVGELQQPAPYTTPIKTEEGILDWKSLEWIMHKENAGVATNLRSYLPTVLADTPSCNIYHSVFEDDVILETRSYPLEYVDEVSEIHIIAQIKEYMKWYMEQTKKVQWTY